MEVFGGNACQPVKSYYSGQVPVLYFLKFNIQN